MQMTERDDLLELIAMAREGIEWCEANGEDVSDKQRAVLAEYEARLARLGSGTGRTWTEGGSGTGKPRRLTDRPAGGKTHRNQYGACTVRVASEAQPRYIKGLMDERDLSALEDSVIIDVARLRMQVATNTVNKTAASAIIDRLKGQPVKPLVKRLSDSLKSLATDKQLALVKKLATEKVIEASDVSKIAYVVGGGRPTKQGTSELIGRLLDAPVVTVKAEASEIEAGAYTNGVDTYRVYLGQKSGTMLAAKVERHGNEAHFEYAGAASRFITADFRKLTIEEAAEFGKATETCIVCGRRLDVPESVDRGIGPVCFAKMGG